MLKMDNLEEILRNNRPTASPSTLRTYRSILKTIAYRITHSLRWVETLPYFLTADFFRDNKEHILRYVNNSNLNTRKTQLCALYILTGDEDYHKSMMTDIKASNDEVERQEMNEKQQHNWISWEDVKSIYQANEDLVLPEMFSDGRGIRDKMMFQQLIIMALTTGVFIPPRRLMDWAEFKLRNINPETDNYISHRREGSVFVFNTYKTVKKYGRQEIAIPEKLHMMLRRWEEINHCDYLLVNTLGGKLGVSGLNQQIEKSFKLPTGGKKIGVNMLRHIYVSEKFADELKDRKKVANMMAHRLETQAEYIKH
jgi:hypothetical protein